jgi:hypothetical protein
MFSSCGLLSNTLQILVIKSFAEVMVVVLLCVCSK